MNQQNKNSNSQDQSKYIKLLILVSITTILIIVGWVLCLKYNFAQIDKEFKSEGEQADKIVEQLKGIVNFKNNEE